MVSLCNKASVYDLMSFLSYAISKSAANLCVHNPVYSLFECVCVCFSGRPLPGILGKLVAEGRRAENKWVYSSKPGTGVFTPRSVVTTLVYFIFIGPGFDKNHAFCGLQTSSINNSLHY